MSVIIIVVVIVVPSVIKIDACKNPYIQRSPKTKVNARGLPGTAECWALDTHLLTTLSPCLIEIPTEGGVRATVQAQLGAGNDWDLLWSNQPRQEVGAPPVPAPCQGHEPRDSNRWRGGGRQRLAGWNRPEEARGGDLFPLPFTAFPIPFHRPFQCFLLPFQRLSTACHCLSNAFPPPLHCLPLPFHRLSNAFHCLSTAFPMHFTAFPPSFHRPFTAFP